MNKKDNWKKLANEIKEIRNKLLKISVNNETIELLNGKTKMRDLEKAVQYIDEFRDKSEEEMFKQGIEDLNLWYGDGH